MSDFLVSSLQPAVNALGLSKPFVGLILVPVIGNAAEHAGAVRLAVHDQMDVAIEIAVGSSTQIALFVAPFLVFFSLAVGKPLPTLPLWLSDELNVSLDLEAGYEDTCRILRIP